MKNLRTNFRKFYGICQELFKQEIDIYKNLRFRPVWPKMNDIEIMDQLS